MTRRPSQTFGLSFTGGTGGLMNCGFTTLAVCANKMAGGVAGDRSLRFENPRTDGYLEPHHHGGDCLVTAPELARNATGGDPP